MSKNASEFSQRTTKEDNNPNRIMMFFKRLGWLCLLVILFGKNHVQALPKFDINVEDYVLQEQNLDSEESQEFDINVLSSAEPTSIEEDLEEKYRSKIEAKIMEVASEIVSKRPSSQGLFK